MHQTDSYPVIDPSSIQPTLHFSPHARANIRVIALGLRAPSVEGVMGKMGVGVEFGAGFSPGLSPANMSGLGITSLKWYRDCC